MKLFAEAWQIKSGGSLTGADAQAALLKAMERGEVRSADILPLVGKLMKTAASGGIDAARTSSIAEQARAQNAQGQLLATFSQEGGEAGFANFWRTVAKALKDIQPLVVGLAGTFERLTTVLQAPVRLFGLLGNATQYLATTFGTAEKNIVTIAGLGALLATKWGRVATIFTAIAVVLEDIAFGVAGRDSYTKDFMTWVEQLTGLEYDTQSGILGWSTALAVSLYGVYKAMSLLKNLYDVLPDGLKPSGSSKLPDSTGKGGAQRPTSGGGRFGKFIDSAKNSFRAGGAAGALGFIAATTGGIKELPEGVTAIRVPDFVSPSRMNTLEEFGNGIYSTSPEELTARMISQAVNSPQMSSGSQIIIQSGAIQMDISGGDPQQIGLEVERRLQSIFQDAMLSNALDGG